MVRTSDDADPSAIEALSALLGGPVGVEALLGDLNRRGRRGWAPGRAVTRALTWDRADRRTPRWWPQGISSSADASESDRVAGRRVLAVSWYAKPVSGDDGSQGVRVSFLDLDTHRYRHVLLVVPTLAADGSLWLEPLRVHAGGLVWHGDWLHVAATGRGLVSCHLGDLLWVPDERASGDLTRLGVDGEGVSTYGYRYLLPVRRQRVVAPDGGPRLRCSFLSLDRSGSVPALLVGEYTRGEQSRRLVRLALDPSTGLPVVDAGGAVESAEVAEGVAQMQGAVVLADGRTCATVSHGARGLGSVAVGGPGAWPEMRWATPMGPEDLTAWPSTGLLWSVSEHPRRRWLFAMDALRLARR